MSFHLWRNNLFYPKSRCENQWSYSDWGKNNWGSNKTWAKKNVQSWANKNMDTATETNKESNSGIESNKAEILKVDSQKKLTPISNNMAVL